GRGLGLADVLALALPVDGRAAGPAALLALEASGRVDELVRDLGELEVLRERARDGGLLEVVGLELLDRGEPLVLVHGVASDEEGEQVTHAGVRGDLGDAAGLSPAVRPRGGDVAEGRVQRSPCES